MLTATIVAGLLTLQVVIGVAEDPVAVVISIVTTLGTVGLYAVMNPWIWLTFPPVAVLMRLRVVVPRTSPPPEVLSVPSALIVQPLVALAAFVPQAIGTVVSKVRTSVRMTKIVQLEIVAAPVLASTVTVTSPVVGS